MEIEKIESVAIDVKDLGKAVKLFSDIFSTTFIDLAGIKDERAITKDADHTLEAKHHIAIERRGFIELIESTPRVEKEGLRALVVKVRDIEAAKAEMKQKGIRLAKSVQFGNAKEAVYVAEDLHGVRLTLVQHDEPSFIDAVKGDFKEYRLK